MNFTHLRYALEDRKAVITLNRPQKRNALNDTLIGELTGAFLAAGREPQARVVVLRAEGPAFCAGADLDELQRIAQQNLEQNRADATKLASLYRLMYEVRKPVIAAVHGPALAGGCGLATVCDFVVAAEDKAQFGYPEVRIGMVPAIVMTFLIKRVGEGRARELVLRGNVLTAREAQSIGLVGQVVPDRDLTAAVDALVEELVTRNSPIGMGLCKELIGRLHGMNLQDALDFAANVNATARMTPDCKQGIDAFLNKTTPQW